MTKKEQKACPPSTKKTGQNISKTDIETSTHKQKNVGTIIGTQSLAGTEVRIVEAQGRIGIPEMDVAEGLDQDRSGFGQLLERNEAILDNYPWMVMVPIRGKMRKLRLLTLENTRRSIMMVDHNVKDPARKEFLIQRKRQYFQIIDDVYGGKNSQLVDVGSLKDNPKLIQGDNSFRRALFVVKVNKAHPSAPNTVKRLHALSHNDQRLVRGPHVPFEPGAHLKYSKEQAIKDSAQKAVSLAAIACGNIEIEDINRFEREVFRGLPEKYIPDYLSGVIETTKQMVLIPGDVSA